MRPILTFFFVALSTTIINSQINLSSDELNFPITKVGTQSSRSFTVSNLFPTEKEFRLELLTNTSFSTTDTIIVLQSGQQIPITLFFNPKQNVIEEGFAVFQSLDSTEAFLIKLKGSGNHNDIYDSFTFNLYDVELKTALTNYVSNHTSLGYNTARDKMFMEIDNKKVNGGGATQNTLECVYTGRLAVGYTNRTDAQNNYNFNTEHTYPQSMFGSSEPMYSDLFHLYPTDNTANSIRGNYIFGVVSTSITWNVAGSKRGTGWNGNIVFEPRDVHKGNVSRSMLYFQLRYPQNYGSFLDTSQENIFRVWNKIDTVDSAERTRNTAIAALQGKRNPLIDHPEFVDRILSFRSNTNRAKFAYLNLFPSKTYFDSTEISDTSFVSINLVNKGSATLTISSININDSRFKVLNVSNSITPFSNQKIQLAFIPDSVKEYNGELSIQTSIGNYVYYVSGIGKEKPLSAKSDASDLREFSLENNYPNPFNPSTVINFSIPSDGEVILKLYDVLGHELVTLINEYKQKGKYSYDFDVNTMGLNLSSGMYIYRLTHLGNILSKKMILIK